MAAASPKLVQAVLLVALCTLFVRAGWAAATPGPGPQALVDDGVARFKAGEHLEALQRFERAHQASGDPQVLYLIARCHEELGRWAEALQAYQRFVSTAEVPADARGRAESSIRRLTGRLSRARLILQVVPFGTPVLVDGVSVGVAPVEPVDLKPGEHTVEVGGAGQQVQRHQVQLAGGEERSLVVELATPPASAPTSPSDASPSSPPGASSSEPESSAFSRRFPWRWVLMGGGAALGAAGVVAAGLGEADHRRVTGADGYDGDSWVAMDYTEARTLDEQGTRRKRLGLALAGGGLALAGAGLLLALLPTEFEGATGPQAWLGTRPDGTVLAGAAGRF